MHSEEQVVRVGHHVIGVHHPLPGQQELVVHLTGVDREHPGRYRSGTWVVANGDGRVVRTRVNPPHGYDTSLAGWVKVQDGEVVPPSNVLIQRGVHLSTQRCKEQVFSVDTSGLHLGSLHFDKQADTGLVWDGRYTGEYLKSLPFFVNF